MSTDFETRLDEALVNIHRITLRYLSGLNAPLESIEVIREELRKLHE